jgi:threonine/homoserine/homoserine lactone efflux protein
VDWETWGVYVAVVTAICVTPGPAVLFVITQASWRGPRAGVAGVLGIETANLVFWTLSAFGLAAMIAASHTAFVALKWAGALYLAWLGIQAIRGSFKPDSPVEPARVAANAFRDGLVVGLSNPKSLLFFLALLPQFVDPSRPALPQIAILAVTGSGIDLTTNTIYALLAGAFRRALAQSRARRWFDRGIGAVFLALAGAAAVLRRAS